MLEVSSSSSLATEISPPIHHISLGTRHYSRDSFMTTRLSFRYCRIAFDSFWLTLQVADLSHVWRYGGITTASVGRRR